MASHLDDYLTLIDFKTQINNMPATSKAALLLNAKGLPVKYITKMGEALYESLDGSDLFKMFSKKIKQDSSDDDFKQLLIAAKSPLGLKSIKAEKVATKSNVSSGFKTYVASLSKKKPTQARIIQIASVMKISGALQSAQDQAVRLALQLAIGENATKVLKKRKKIEVITNEVSLQESQIKTKTSKEIIMYGLYIYKGFSDKELDEYLELFENKEVQAALILLNSTLDDILNTSMRDYPFLLEGKFKLKSNKKKEN
jgi:hypothetical protein